MRHLIYNFFLCGNRHLIYIDILHLIHAHRMSLYLRKLYTYSDLHFGRDYR